MATNNEAQHRERRLAQETALLAEIGKIMTSDLEIEGVYERFASEVKKLVNFARITVNHVDHESETFVFRYVSGLVQSTRKVGDVLPLENTQTGEVVRTGASLVRTDVSADPSFRGDQTLMDMGMNSSLLVPLRYRDRIIGTLSLRSAGAGAYGPVEQSLLERVADQVAPSIVNAGLYAESQSAQAALRSAEERYHRVFSETHDPIGVLSDNGTILDANQAYIDVLGYELEELQGMAGRSLFVDPEEHTRLVEEASANGSVRDLEIQLKKKNGSIADCILSLTVQRDREGCITGYQGMFRDVTESKLAQVAELEHTREVAVLEERNRMAREIHDTMAQGFTGIVLQLEAAEQAAEQSPDALQGHLDRARHLAREGLQEARRSVWGLLPQALEQKPLDAALTDEIGRFDTELDGAVSFNISGSNRELSTDVQTVLLRVCQESLTNVKRHAQASHVSVNLEFLAHQVSLRIQDNGVGFEGGRTPEEKIGKSFGLLGMLQRAEQLGGQLEIESSPGNGTSVILTLPA